LVEAQGGDPHVVDDTSLLPAAPTIIDVHAPQDAWLATVDAEAIGRASGALGAGRQKLDDVIDPAVGLSLHVKIGDQSHAGDTIGRIFARDGQDARNAELAVLQALGWSPLPVSARPLVHEIVDPAQGLDEVSFNNSNETGRIHEN